MAEREGEKEVRRGGEVYEAIFSNFLHILLIFEDISLIVRESFVTV